MIAVGAAVLALISPWFTVRLARRSLRVTTYSSAPDLTLQIDRLMIEYPETRSSLLGARARSLRGTPAARAGRGGGSVRAGRRLHLGPQVRVRRGRPPSPGSATSRTSSERRGTCSATCTEESRRRTGTRPWTRSTASRPWCSPRGCSVGSARCNFVAVAARADPSIERWCGSDPSGSLGRPTHPTPADRSPRDRRAKTPLKRAQPASVLAPPAPVGRAGDNLTPRGPGS